MSDEGELKEYLKKSRQSRREICEKAEEYIKPVSNPNSLSVSSNITLEFPSFTPKRLMDFKEQVNQNLRLVFKPREQSNSERVPVLRSISKEDYYRKIYLPNIKEKKRRIQSNHFNMEKKHVFMLPKFAHKEQYLVPMLSRYSKK